MNTGEKTVLGKSERLPRPRVCAVDDDSSVLQAIKLALESLDVEVCGYSSAEAFLDDYHPGEVACLLVDHFLPGASGLTLMERLHDDQALQTVMISGRGTIASAVSAMKSGAIEYLEKPYDNASLRKTVETAIERNRKLSERVREREQRQQLVSLLTDAEIEVVHAAASGEAIKEIAAKLDISVRTVHMRLSCAMEKTKTDNKIALIKLVCYSDLQR